MVDMSKARLSKVPARYRKNVEKRLAQMSVVLQERRKQMGLTQEELAEKLELSPMTIQFVEQGRRFPSLPTLIAICMSLEIRLDFYLD